MLMRERDASRSVAAHLSFLRRLAANEPMSEGLREHLMTHIGEEETEHQAHLARLLPALEQLEQHLGAPRPTKPAATETTEAPSSESSVTVNVLTVGSLVDKRPWFTGSK
jgi:hypothetical protein